MHGDERRTAATSAARTREKKGFHAFLKNSFANRPCTVLRVTFSLSHSPPFSRSPSLSLVLSRSLSPSLLLAPCRNRHVRFSPPPKNHIFPHRFLPFQRPSHRDSRAHPPTDFSARNLATFPKRIPPISPQNPCANPHLFPSVKKKKSEAPRGVQRRPRGPGST